MEIWKVYSSKPLPELATRSLKIVDGSLEPIEVDPKKLSLCKALDSVVNDVSHKPQLRLTQSDAPETNAKSQEVA